MHSTGVTSKTPVARPKPRLRGVLHVMGAILAVPAMVVLCLHARSGSGWGAAVYGASLVSLLTASAIYHTPNWSPETRVILRRLDHSMIYVLIAGSYTPFCLAVGGAPAGFLLPVVWVAALLGVVKSMLWVNSPRFVTALLYLLLSWGVVPYVPLFSAVLSPSIIALLAAGGVMYTSGAVAYARQWPDPAPMTFGYHEIFHALVLGASVCHYSAVWLTVS